MQIKKLAAIIASYMGRQGLAMGIAVAPEVDKLDAVPEFQRGWYVPGEAGKFKLDVTKMDVEDVSGLKSTVQATRAEVAAAKAAREQAVRDALKPFEGIDPVKVRGILSQFENEEEAALIAQGPEGIKKVVERRMEKERNALQQAVSAAEEKATGALEVAQTFMEKVLDNNVRAATAEVPGFVKSATDDALRLARDIFSLDDDGNAVQYDKDGETVIMGKDGKTPFSPQEWLESMRDKKPHWFVASGSGGGAGGSKGKGATADMAGLSPQQRMTMARQNAGKR